MRLETTRNVPQCGLFLGSTRFFVCVCFSLHFQHIEQSISFGCFIFQQCVWSSSQSWCWFLARDQRAYMWWIISLKQYWGKVPGNCSPLTLCMEAAAGKRTQGTSQAFCGITGSTAEQRAPPPLPSLKLLMRINVTDAPEKFCYWILFAAPFQPPHPANGAVGFPCLSAPALILTLNIPFFLSHYSDKVFLTANISASFIFPLHPHPRLNAMTTQISFFPLWP